MSLLALLFKESIQFLYLDSTLFHVDNAQLVLYLLAGLPMAQ